MNGLYVDQSNGAEEKTIHFSSLFCIYTWLWLAQGHSSHIGLPPHKTECVLRYCPTTHEIKKKAS